MKKIVNSKSFNQIYFIIFSFFFFFFFASLLLLFFGKHNIMNMKVFYSTSLSWSKIKSEKKKNCRRHEKKEKMKKIYYILGTITTFMNIPRKCLFFSLFHKKFSSAKKHKKSGVFQQHKCILKKIQEEREHFTFRCKMYILFNVLTYKHY